MQVTASNPSFVKREDVPEEVREHEKTIYRKQALDSGKPEKILDKIAEGKLEKFYQEVCLMEQPFIKNPDITVKELLQGLVTKLGENMAIRRFTRFQLGETAEV
jgi:elongation factor Ts